MIGICKFKSNLLLLLLFVGILSVCFYCWYTSKHEKLSIEKFSELYPGYIRNNIMEFTDESIDINIVIDGFHFAPNDGMSAKIKIENKDNFVDKDCTVTFAFMQNNTVVIEQSHEMQINCMSFSKEIREVFSDIELFPYGDYYLVANILIGEKVYKIVGEQIKVVMREE
ncbi:MAG: hypothetical protein JEZ07_12440 [Phycisphaerae bacterium]|nr:hypothetical protein [Phycisphaerae bacterium]